MRHRLVSSVLATVSFLIPMCVGGAARADSTHERSEAALSRIAQGRWTDEDLALIRAQPDLAAQVPDPRRPPHVDARTAVVATGATLATTCKSYWVDYSYYSLLGSKIYTWEKFVTACYNGSVVTSINERYDWLPYRQTMITVKERTLDDQSVRGSWQYSSRIERHLEYCVAKYGCYADTYPWAQFKIYGNGTWWYQGANS